MDSYLNTDSLNESLLSDYKLTPATLAFKLENLECSPDKLAWYPANHLMYISMQIATAIANGNGRIIISAPPRHGKSKLCTHYGPLWVAEMFPGYNIGLVTYGAELSEDFSREVRDSIFKHPQLLNVRIREDANRIARFLFEGGGSMTSIGMGGPFTGRGVNVLFIDDYIKQIKEALSETIREQQWEWLTTTALTRLEPNATVIIIATRWHDDDLIGRIIKRYPEEWTYIRIPALAEKDDILGRQVGEALFPKRFSLRSIQERKRLLGTIFFDALYQQAPHSDANSYAKRAWLQKIQSIPDHRLRFVRVWDLASTAGGGDYTAGGLLALDTETNDVILIDMKRKQLSPGKVEELVLKMAGEDPPGTEIVIEQEPGSAGAALIESYKKLLKGYKVHAYKASTAPGKLIQAQPLLAGAEDGRFKVLEAGWFEDFAKEFENFPGGKHDDQVDVCAIGWLRLVGKLLLKATWAKTQQADVYDVQSRMRQMEREADKQRRQIERKKQGVFKLISGATFGRRRAA